MDLEDSESKPHGAQGFYCILAPGSSDAEF
jgi:hypothetical protein